MKQPTYPRIQARTLRGLKFKLAVLRIFGWRQRSDFVYSDGIAALNIRPNWFCYVGRRYDNEG